MKTRLVWTSVAPATGELAWYKTWQWRDEESQASTVFCRLPLLGLTSPAIRISTMSFTKLAAIAALATVASGKPELL